MFFSLNGLTLYFSFSHSRSVSVSLDTLLLCSNTISFNLIYIFAVFIVFTMNIKDRLLGTTILPSELMRELRIREINWLAHTVSN